MRRRWSAAFVAVTVLACAVSAEGSRVVVEPSAVVRLEPPEGSPEGARYVVSVELPGSLEGATVDYARLRLDAEVTVSVPAAGPLMVEVYGVTTGWSAVSVGWETPWAEPGGDFDERSHAAHVGASSEHAQITLDVTGIVQGWVDGEAENHGLLVLTPSGSGHAVVGMSETQAPVVEIWTTAGAR